MARFSSLVAIGCLDVSRPLIGPNKAEACIVEKSGCHDAICREISVAPCEISDYTYVTVSAAYTHAPYTRRCHFTRAVATMAAVMSASQIAPRVAKLGARVGNTTALKAPTVRSVRPAVVARRTVRAAAGAVDTDTGLKMARDGIKEAANENLLTPRFYTTDFDEMEQLFSTAINPNLDESELVAILQEFQEDFNQKHFVRSDSFKSAADGITGESRRIFIEFLERSCTAEFSGFLLYKELGRRLKKTAPVCAEIFTLMSRDEARHAGFLNKAMYARAVHAPLSLHPCRRNHGRCNVRLPNRPPRRQARRACWKHHRAEGPHCAVRPSGCGGAPHRSRRGRRG